MKFLMIAALLGAAVGATAVLAECADTRVDLRGDWGQARFTVEVAKEPAELARGLMNRPSMPASAGMIFVYPTPRSVHFWMENTLIPLDMLFLSAEGVVQKIHENAVPLDRTNIPGGDNIQFVLEINGGMSKTLGISVGSELRHPEIPQEIAAWACNEE